MKSLNFNFGTKVAPGERRWEESVFMRKIKILLLGLILSFLSGGCSPTGLLDSIMDRSSRGDVNLVQNQATQNGSQQVQARFGEQPSGKIDLEKANQLLHDVDGSYLVELQNQGESQNGVQQPLVHDRKLIPVYAQYDNGHLRLAPYEQSQQDHLIFADYNVTNVEGSRVTLTAPVEKKNADDKTEIEEKWQGTSMMQIDVSSDPVVARFQIKYHYEKKSKSIYGTWGTNVTETLNMEVKWQAIFSRALMGDMIPTPDMREPIKGCFPPGGCVIEPDQKEEKDEAQTQEQKPVSESVTTRNYEFISRDDSGSLQLSVAFKNVSELPENKMALSTIKLHSIGKGGELKEIMAVEQEIDVQYGYHLNNVVISKDGIQTELNIVIVPFGEVLLGTVKIIDGETTANFGFTQD